MFWSFYSQKASIYARSGQFLRYIWTKKEKFCNICQRYKFMVEYFSSDQINYVAPEERPLLQHVQ